MTPNTQHLAELLETMTTTTDCLAAEEKRISELLDSERELVANILDAEHRKLSKILALVAAPIGGKV